MPFHLKMTGTSSTDDASVKAPSFQEVTFFPTTEIFHRDASICIIVCMKMFLRAEIKDKRTSNDSLKSDSSFLLRYSMMTAKLLKFSVLHAVYTESSHCSVRLTLCDTVLKFFCDYVSLLDVTILVWKLKKECKVPSI